MGLNFPKFLSFDFVEFFMKRLFNIQQLLSAIENYLSAHSVIAGFSVIPRTQWGCPDLGDLNQDHREG
jgi:hypothetical protein